jgi:hypothetical protein
LPSWHTLRLKFSSQPTGSHGLRSVLSQALTGFRITF